MITLHLQERVGNGALPFEIRRNDREIGSGTLSVNGIKLKWRGGTYAIDPTDFLVIFELLAKEQQKF